jgi:hypothetical protein
VVGSLVANDPSLPNPDAYDPLEALPLRSPWVVPVPPENIAFQFGQNAKTYSVISLGEVTIPGGRKVEQISWESHFPAEYDPDIVTIPETEFVSPLQWVKVIRRIHRERKTIRVSIDNSPIDMNGIIYQFNGGMMPGPSGDIWYQITIIEHRPGTIREFDGVKFPNVSGRTRPAGDIPKTYKVNPGQTLEDVSWALYGSTEYWEDIYNLNLEAIVAVILTSPEFNDGTALSEELGIPQPGLAQLPYLEGLWLVTDPLPEKMLLRVPQIAVV